MTTLIQIRAHAALAGMFCLLALSPARAATIGASSDNTKPSQISTYNIAGGVNIAENVALDPTAGPWLKDLVATTGSPSGADRNITEILSNVGGIAWSDWHEQVISRTFINQPNDSPGYLFRQNSVNVAGNYGSGFVTLVEGTDYSITPTNYSGPGSSGNNGNWEAFDINLIPARFILPGESLRIQKQIFEVFLNADVWQSGDTARIGEYPTATGVPEPTAGLLLSAGSALLLRRRRS